MPERDIDLDRIFARRGLKSLHSVTPEAQVLLDEAPMGFTPSDLVNFIAKDIGTVAAWKFVFGTDIPLLGDKKAMAKLALERVEKGWGFRYASWFAGVCESWIRTLADEAKHERKKQRDREYHEANRERRKKVRRAWYLRNKEAHCERQRQNRERRKNQDSDP